MDLRNASNAWNETQKSAAGRLHIKPELIGSWRLLVWEEHNALSGALHYPLGPAAVGRLWYDESGRMSAQVMRRHEPRFAHEDRRRATDAEKIEAWSSYFGYFGTYEVDEEIDAVIHHIEGSWFPNLVGSDQIHHYRFEADNLILAANASWRRVRMIWNKM
jgi:Lipocalin-like domain